MEMNASVVRVIHVEHSENSLEDRINRELRKLGNSTILDIQYRSAGTGGEYARVWDSAMIIYKTEAV